MINKLYPNIKVDWTGNGLDAFTKFAHYFNLPCKCQHRSYNLIFMELSLADSNGLKTCEKILALASDGGEYDYCTIVGMYPYYSYEVQ